MIANFFKKTKPENVFNIVLLLFVYYLISLFLSNTEGFTVLIWVKKISFFLWLIFFLLSVNFIVKKNNLTQDNLYALLIIVLLLGTFSEAMFFNRIIFTNIALLLGFRKIYSLRTHSNTKKKLFDAGFWVGIAALIYSWSLFYLILIYIGIIAYRKLNIKNLFIPLIGFIMPVIIYFTYHFYFDSLPVFYDRFIFDYSLDFVSYNKFKILVPATFLLATITWSIFSVTPKIVMVSNKLKFSWIVLLHHVSISLLVVILSPIKNGSEMLFLIFPAAIIIANFIQKSESVIFKNVVLYVFFAISVVVYFL